ncbi:MAG TPA: DUF6624 domain-containing protein [Tepidisphaeraceae bacterium]|jgi:hypothetical protein
MAITAFRVILAFLFLGLFGPGVGLAAEPPARRESADAPRENESLRAELIKRRAEDQRYRTELQRRLTTGAPAATQPSLAVVALIFKQAVIDRENIARLGEIVDRYGWPGNALVGEEASNAAFLIVQHANLASQKNYLPLLRAAAQRGDANAGDVAMLEDRILTKEGKPQTYGTQLHAGPETGGKLVLYPIADEARVDERRAAVGLSTLAEYLKLFHLEYHPPPGRNPWPEGRPLTHSRRTPEGMPSSLFCSQTVKTRAPRVEKCMRQILDGNGLDD